MKIKTVLCIFITIIAFVFNCGKSDKTYTIEIKDGVLHVHNKAPLWGDEPQVALEFVQKIGVLEGDDENYMFYNPEDVAKDNQGNIYVLDAGNYRIQKFDPEGKYLASFGRKGQGPGDFNRPTSINIDSDGNIYVLDYYNDRVQILSPDGKYKDSYKIKSSLLSILSRSRLLGQDNILINCPPIYPEQSPSDLNLLYLLSPKGENIKGYGELEDHNDYYKNYSFNFSFFDVHEEDIYLTFYYRNCIEKHSADGTHLFTADRKLNYEITYEFIKMPSGRAPDGTEIIRGTPRISWVSFCMAVDGEGRTWIVTVIEQKKKGADPETAKPWEERVEFQIFDSDGIWITRLHVPCDFDNMRIFNDRMFLIDRSNEMCVYEYKIVEK